MSQSKKIITNSKIQNFSKVRIIGGIWKGTVLPVLKKVEGLRPTPNRVRETLFNWLGQNLSGKYCIDFFSGSGILGFEAASRGANRIMLIESNNLAAKQLKINCHRLNAKQINVIKADALKFVKKLKPCSFDISFLDPPFSSNLLPQALELAIQLTHASGYIYIESNIHFLIGKKKNYNNWYITKSYKAGKVYSYLLRYRT